MIHIMMAAARAPRGMPRECRAKSPHVCIRLVQKYICRAISIDMAIEYHSVYTAVNSEVPNTPWPGDNRKVIWNYSVLFLIVVHLVSLCILVVHTSLLVVLLMFLVHLVVLLGLFFKFYYRLLQSTTAVVTWL